MHFAKNLCLKTYSEVADQQGGFKQVLSLVCLPLF